MPRIGETFGRYRLDSQLGQGGMGTVFRAFDTVLQRAVALKIVRSGSPDGPESTNANARLLREARAAAALHHPNVVSVFDVGEHDGVPFISMELVEGSGLRTLAGAGNHDWRERVTWLQGIARALQAAHRIGLVHRDIKPDNVFVATDGTIKVLDFGIARTTKKVAPDEPTMSAGLGTLTAPGAVVGTPMYMSPEQLQGEPATSASDQFAWGTVAYEVLAGQSPWAPATSAMKVFSAILLREPRDLANVAPDVPEAVRGCVHRALAKEAKDRYPSMDEIARILEAELGLSTGAAAVSAGTGSVTGATRAGGTRRIGRWGLVAAGLGLAVALAVGVGGLGLPRPSREGLAPTASSQGPVGMASAPHTPSLVPAAEAAFRGALQAYRDGVYSVAVAGMKDAVRLDPSMACAWLRLAIWSFQGDPKDARRCYVEARKFRDTLSGTDRDVWDALSPFFEAAQVDLVGFAQKCSELADRHPESVELAFYAGHFNTVAGRMEEATRRFSRTIDADPGFAAACTERAVVTAYTGGDWRSASATCLERDEASLADMSSLVLMEEDAGDCEQAESHARHWATMAPDDAEASGNLARAQFALGRPVEAVVETLKRKRLSAHRKDNVMQTHDAGAIDLYDGIALDVLRGSFVAAEAKARALENATESAQDETSHALPARRLVELLLETDRKAEAASVANQYLLRREGWTEDSMLDDWAVERDIKPQMQAALLRAGAISEEEWRARRTAWLESWPAQMPPFWRKWLWTHGYARPAETAEEAKEALAALPDYSPQPVFRPETLADADVGRVYYLAGQPREAIPLLEKATRSCLALAFPFVHTRAHYFLGLARAAVGDTAGACEALGVVLARWGKATPKSTTATLAAQRSNALHCPPR